MPGQPAIPELSMESTANYNTVFIHRFLKTCRSICNPGRQPFFIATSPVKLTIPALPTQVAVAFLQLGKSGTGRYVWFSVPSLDS